MARIDFDAIFATPTPPPIYRQRREAGKAKWARELQEHGLPAPLATQVATTCKTRAALDEAKLRWTGRCAMTGVPFGDGPTAAVVRADGEFVLASVAKLQGGLTDATFLRLCRLVAAHCAGHRPPPAPATPPPAAPAPPPQPALLSPQRSQHGNDDIDFGPALGMHHQGGRTQEFDYPDDSPGPAGGRGGVWTWNPQLGRAVLSAE